jgi:hypothetical protein
MYPEPSRHFCPESLCTNECMVKRGATTERRLIIDVVDVRQSYERRKLSDKVDWYGNGNPANAMTKAKPSKALQTLVDTNELRVKVVGWVDRLE